jgi:hypothetical protein
MQVLTRMRRVVALVGATALASTPLLVTPTAADAAVRPTTSRAAMSHVTATLTKKTIRMSGVSGLRAGRVMMDVKGKGIVELARFAKGYDVSDFTADLARFGAKNDLKALKRALRKTTILGGYEGGGSGTVVLGRGSYTPFSIGERGVVTGDAFRVRGPRRTSRAPSTDGRILARPGPSWGGSSQLPASGTFLFKNKATTGIPHFVVLQQVAEGTTTDEVLTYLQTADEQAPPPSWAMPGGMETGSLSPGRKMTVDYDLPPGQYVVMCFFPDPAMGGMPHALMGMLEMIHLT